MSELHNKGMQLTRPVQIAASQLIASVLRTVAGAPMGGGLPCRATRHVAAARGWCIWITSGVHCLC